ncbi:MAG: DJ-1/PfpI family protein [Eggerthellaceae bacterium]|nr:DJ-1/PfpI family protein [Eggerthellaceae bacterium]
MATKRVLVFLAEGFEDYEAVCATSLCRWTEYRPHLPLIEVTTAGLHREVHGRFGTSFAVDALLSDVDPQSFDALVIPGGFHSHGFDEIYCEDVYEFIRRAHASGAVVATMCVGVLCVAESGVLAQGRATTYALSKNHDNVAILRATGCAFEDAPVVCSDRVISCAGPEFSQEVVYRMVDMLIGEEGTRELARYRKGLAG